MIFDCRLDSADIAQKKDTAVVHKRNNASQDQSVEVGPRFCFVLLIEQRE